jgi:hypothetical protein
METVLQTEVNISDQKRVLGMTKTLHVQEFVPTCIVAGKDSSGILRHFKKLC